jgi:hypothetical protein
MNGRIARNRTAKQLQATYYNTLDFVRAVCVALGAMAVNGQTIGETLNQVRVYCIHQLHSSLIRDVLSVLNVGAKECAIHVKPCKSFL